MNNPTVKQREKERLNLHEKVRHLKSEVEGLKISNYYRLKSLQEAKDNLDKAEAKYDKFEQEVCDMTATLSEHPQISLDNDDLWDGPCLCAECRSYGA